MPYVDYNLSLYRTGFRPYGMTNPWSATQLNGYGLGTGIRPFTPSGGHRLGQIQRGMSPMVLHGLGQVAAVCLDQNENNVPCTSPDCTYGDCGSTAAQVTVGALCLDESENQIDCSSPACAFGDCISGTAKKPGTRPAAPGVSPAPGPSPRTYAPMTLFPQTAPLTTYSASTGGALNLGSMLLPMAAVLLVVALVAKK